MLMRIAPYLTSMDPKFDAEHADEVIMINAGWTRTQTGQWIWLMLVRWAKAPFSCLRQRTKSKSQQSDGTASVNPSANLEPASPGHPSPAPYTDASSNTLLDDDEPLHVLAAFFGDSARDPEAVEARDEPAFEGSTSEDNTDRRQDLQASKAQSLDVCTSGSRKRAGKNLFGHERTPAKAGRVTYSEPETSRTTSVSDKEDTYLAESLDLRDGKRPFAVVSMTGKSRNRPTIGGIELSDSSLADEASSDDENARKSWTVGMQMHNAGDQTGENNQYCMAMIDSGSARSFTFRKVLQELGAEDRIYPNKRTVRTLQHETFKTVGEVSLRWNVSQRPDQTYTTKFDVLEHLPGKEPDFDFLLGRNWLKKCKAIRRDFQEIPEVYFFAPP